MKIEMCYNHYGTDGIQSPYFALLHTSPDSIASLQADYIAVVEDKPI